MTSVAQAVSIFTTLFSNDETPAPIQEERQYRLNLIDDAARHAFKTIGNLALETMYSEDAYTVNWYTTVTDDAVRVEVVYLHESAELVYSIGSSFTGEDGYKIITTCDSDKAIETLKRYTLNWV